MIVSVPIHYRPIGVVHSSHTEISQTPIQPVYAADSKGQVELFPEYAEGLTDLDSFSHLYLLYHFHRAQACQLRVKPYIDDNERGVFATRATSRPNPIGISLVKLVGRDQNVLHVREIDVLDGTPLLDIKPFISRFDQRSASRSGWQESIDDETASHHGRRLG